MTISLVAVGTGVSGDNASLTPGIPAGALAGDLVLVYATIRNTAATAACSGYALLQSAGNSFLFYKVHTGAEAAPTVTFTGGSSGDTTLAQIAVFRGAWANETALASVLNSSGQNITLPAAVTPNRNGSLLLVLAWKQDDWTSPAGAVTGMTELGETVSTAGNDAGQAWYYQVQTASAASPTGSITLTGGAAAISRCVVAAIGQAATITVTPQDVYPPRVLVSVTGLVVGDSVELYRVVGADRIPVRGGSDPDVTDTSFIRADAELPFGVPLSYVAVINGDDGPASAPVTYTLPGGKVALTDAVTGLAAEVVITAWPDATYQIQSSTFQVGGRNVAVLGALAPPSSSMDVYVETTSAADNVEALLAAATSGIIQVRQPGGYDGVDGYFAVTGVVRHRFSQDGSDQKRTFTLTMLEVDGWAPALEARAFTYADVEAAYTGLTYADAEDDFATYLDAMLADWGA